MKPFQTFTRTKIFWILFSLLSAAGFFYCYNYFSQAFPIVNLSITFDREQAIEQAQKINRNHKWTDQDYQSAASFSVDSLVQNYTELEGGGSKAFSQIIEEQFYFPYRWIVRSFKEQEINESVVLLSPSGKPFGFKHTIPQDKPGSALTKEEAQKSAHIQIKEWGYNSDEFTLAESSSKKQANDRIDHTFVYESIEKKIGNAPYRLTIKISGNEPTQLTLSPKIPDSFIRQYQHMRSFNETLARIASFIAYIIYFFLATLLGLLYLFKRRAVLWQPAFIWAGLIALMQFLSHLNNLPNKWLYYDTSISQHIFLFQQVLAGIQIFILYFGVGSLMIAAAEGLSRLAFGNQPLFWESWSRKASNSIQIISRTLGGYLLVGIQLAYVTFFYFLCLKYFGWWQPSQHLYDPDTLATYLPWLSPIASSLGAGFLEECLFRVIPLSIAALIGSRYKKRTLFVGVMLIVQAFVFGAAHANYAAQPFYARMVELIIPSINFALIFLYFGMLPAIISHFIYDVIWFSLPLFIAHTSGIWINRSLVILLSTIPLFPLLFSLVKNKNISKLPSRLYNRLWQPPILKHEVEHKQSLQKPTQSLSIFVLIALTILGLCSWIYFSPFAADTTPVTLSRGQAITLAQKELENTIKPNEWTAVARLENPLEYQGKNSLKRQHLFTWQTGGSLAYKNLSGTFLLPPSWRVRFIKFDGSLEERAEEYQVIIFGNGTVARVKHILPEEQPLQSLSKEQALNLIGKEKLTLLSEPYSLVSAKEKKQLNRIDWIATYSTATQELEDGQKRFRATVSGNLITDAYRFIFVPEQWQRTFNNEQQLHAILKSFTSLIIYLLLLMGMMFIFIYRKQHLSFSIKAAGIIAIIILIRSILQTINMWPQYLSFLRTSEPYSHQIFSLLNSIAITYILKILIFGALAGLVLANVSHAKNGYECLKRRLLAGTALGLVFAGINALLQWFGPHKIPTFPDLSTTGAIIPSIGYSLFIFQECIEATLTSLLFIWIAEKVDGPSIKQKASILLLFIAMMMSVTFHSIETIQFSIIAGLILGLIVYGCYKYLVKADQAVLPIGIGTYYILLAIRQSILNHSYGSIATIITTIIIISCWALWTSRMITRDVNTISPQERS